MNNRVLRIPRLVTAALALMGSGDVLSSGRSAHAQGAASEEGAVKGSARTIAQARSLVMELEAQAERRRSELRATEATLRRGGSCSKNWRRAG